MFCFFFYFHPINTENWFILFLLTSDCSCINCFHFSHSFCLCTRQKVKTMWAGNGMWSENISCSFFYNFPINIDQKQIGKNTNISQLFGVITHFLTMIMLTTFVHWHLCILATFIREKIFTENAEWAVFWTKLYVKIQIWPVKIVEIFNQMNNWN